MQSAVRTWNARMSVDVNFTDKALYVLTFQFNGRRVS